MNNSNTANSAFEKSLGYGSWNPVGVPGAAPGWQDSLSLEELDAIFGDGQAEIQSGKPQVVGGYDQDHKW